MAHIESLREDWKTLYSKTLPQLAKQRDSAQSKWPVTLDHCFARIILDNTVGEGSQQWDKVIKKPAVKNMTAAQLQDAIALGEKIRKGEMDLQELDQISLMCRGKNEGKYGGSKKAAYDVAGSNDESKKRHATAQSRVSPPRKRLKTTHKQQSTLVFSPTTSKTKTSSIPISNSNSDQKTSTPSVDFEATLQRIRSSSITPYRKRVYTILLSVPRGRHTTYAAMSDHLHSSARAVGNGIRNNPFAPDVPCHRVLAADGSLGGFHGDWGREGKYADRKIELLRGEGVRFDGRGKVVGEVFRKFHEFEEV